MVNERLSLRIWNKRFRKELSGPKLGGRLRPKLVPKLRPKSLAKFGCVVLPKSLGEV